MVLLTLLGSLPCSPAAARRFFRARFEAETLELNKAGEVELDAQAGGTYGDGADGSRVTAPDIEIDLGITSWFEIDLDGALSVTQLESAQHRPLAGDPIWLSGRLDLHNWKDAETGATFGVGLQAGPRFPSVNTPEGVGVGALLMVGGGTKKVHVVGTAGALLDQGQHRAVAYGVDWMWELTDDWSLLGDLAASHFFGNETAQVLLDAGFSYKATEQLELSLLAMSGPFVKGDRAGGLLGVRYSFRAFGQGGKD